MKSRNLSAESRAPGYDLKFLPAMCPDCGWDLDGERDSIVLVCRNCKSHWLIHSRNLYHIRVESFGSRAQADVYIPFWKLSVQFSHMACSTYADLIRIVNMPRPNPGVDNRQNLYFYVPAFKVYPKIFLRLARQITIPQIVPSPAAKIADVLFYPVNLPLQEGLQAVPPVLMYISKEKTAMREKLVNEKLRLKSFSLVFIPFRKIGPDFVQMELGFSVPEGSLKFGRRL
jgi:hypothetical protein